MAPSGDLSAVVAVSVGSRVSKVRGRLSSVHPPTFVACNIHTRFSYRFFLLFQMDSRAERGRYSCDDDGIDGGRHAVSAGEHRLVRSVRSPR